MKHNNPKGCDVNYWFYCPQADAGAELKRLEKWLAKTEEKLDGGKIVVSVVILVYLVLGSVFKLLSVPFLIVKE